MNTQTTPEPPWTGQVVTTKKGTANLPHPGCAHVDHDPERMVSGKRPAPVGVPDASGNTAERGDIDGTEWAALLNADDLRQAITAREATVEAGPYNDAYTGALRARLVKLLSGSTPPDTPGEYPRRTDPGRHRPQPPNPT